MIENKTSKAYGVFKRIASSNKRTMLYELESLKPPLIEKKKFKLNEVIPMETLSSDVDKNLKEKRLEAENNAVLPDANAEKQKSVWFNN